MTTVTFKVSHGFRGDAPQNGGEHPTYAAARTAADQIYATTAAYIGSNVPYEVNIHKVIVTSTRVTALMIGNNIDPAA